VTYDPPTGWIEGVDSPPEEADSKLGTFHTVETCERIKDATMLRQVDKPYSAVRCTACAAAT
jgi:hypothetical protein